MLPCKINLTSANIVINLLFFSQSWAFNYVLRGTNLPLKQNYMDFQDTREKLHSGNNQFIAILVDVQNF